MATEKDRGQNVPERITHYSVGAVIGGGGMGVVYRGNDLRDDSAVAIKLLHSHLAEDEAFRGRFEREAHVGALLRSPYVVRLFDYGVAEGRYFLVMEFIEGQSLKEAIAAAPFSAARASRIGAQTARALEEAEVRGIVHRDIKPDNILLGPGDTVKVADFGIAKQLGGGTLTVPGAFIGTLFYAAPEVALGRADNRSDVYALGATLFHAVTGHPPFSGDALEVLRHHAETEVPVDELQSIPEGLRAIIVKCLQKDPDDRYQLCTQLAGDLEKAASRPGQAASDSPTVVSPEPEPEPKAEGPIADTQVVPPEEPPVGEPKKTSAPLARLRGLPSWVPAAAGGLIVAAVAVVALVFLGILGGDDNGGSMTFGRDGLRRMLPAQFELGPEYSAFRLNTDVSGYVSSGAILGPSCPASSTTSTTTTKPLPPPVESYDNQYEFAARLASESGTFALVEGVDNFPDENAASDALNDFIADPVSHITLGGCPDNEIRQSDDFNPAGVGGDATGVEQLIHQTDGDMELEFTVTAVGFTRETILGRVLIAHFDSPQHQSSAADIAADMDTLIEEVLTEMTATPPTPSPSTTTTGTATATATGTATATATRTTTPTEPPVIQKLGCSPPSLLVGQTVTCSPTISGTVTSHSWSASGGSTSSGTGNTFATSFGSVGSKMLSLRVCNSAGCDNGSKSISVLPAIPVINLVGCSPTILQTGQTVTCNPDITGTVTAYGWSVSGGTPSEGSGPTFSTSFSSTGAKVISLVACLEDSGCDKASQSIEVPKNFSVFTGNFSRALGDTFEVKLSIETPSVGLGDYDIEIFYNQTVIAPLGCNDSLGGDCDLSSSEDSVRSSGTANQSGTFTIATFTFEAVGIGVSDLSVVVIDIRTSDGSEASGILETINGSVTVSDVIP